VLKSYTKIIDCIKIGTHNIGTWKFIFLSIFIKLNLGLKKNKLCIGSKKNMHFNALFFYYLYYSLVIRFSTFPIPMQMSKNANYIFLRRCKEKIIITY
jgi:hypothetical protein